MIKKIHPILLKTLHIIYYFIFVYLYVELCKFLISCAPANYTKIDYMYARSGLTWQFLFLTLLFILIVVGKYFLYKRTTFTLGDFGLSSERDFITFSQKMVKYQDIKEVTLHRGILQRLFGVGTVKVSTHATTLRAGISLFNIKEYQEIYDFLIQKVR